MFEFRDDIDGMKAKCHSIIHTATAAAGAAGAIPLPLVDAVPITGAQIAMILGLGGAFGLNMLKCTGTALTSGLLAMQTGRVAASGLLGLIPGLGTAGKVGVAVAFTEGLGWATVNAFDNMSDKERAEGISPKALLELIAKFIKKGH